MCRENRMRLWIQYVSRVLCKLATFLLWWRVYSTARFTSETGIFLISSLYIDLGVSPLNSFMLIMFYDVNGFFQKKKVSSTVRGFFHWPPRLPDLKPIEYIWSILLNSLYCLQLNDAELSYGQPKILIFKQWL